MKTIKTILCYWHNQVNLNILKLPLDKRGSFDYVTRRIVAYLDGLPPTLRFGDRQAKVNALWELQSAGGEELRPFVGRTLMASILDKAFMGEL